MQEIKPQFFENMTQLKILELRDNQIATIPDEIAMLQRLIRLDLTNNELCKYVAFIKLTHCDCEQFFIVSLPRTLALLPHLQNLQLEGNALKQIRNDIIKGGTCRILKFLREKMEDVNIDKSAGASVAQSKTAFPNKYQMRSTKGLTLAMKDLITVPDEIFDDASNAEVSAVDLSKNKLNAVPAGYNFEMNCGEYFFASV